MRPASPQGPARPVPTEPSPVAQPPAGTATRARLSPHSRPAGRRRTPAVTRTGGVLASHVTHPGRALGSFLRPRPCPCLSHLPTLPADIAGADLTPADPARADPGRPNPRVPAPGQLASLLLALPLPLVPPRPGSFDSSAWSRPLRFIPRTLSDLAPPSHPSRLQPPPLLSGPVASPGPVGPVGPVGPIGPIGPVRPDARRPRIAWFRRPAAPARHSPPTTSGITTNQRVSQASPASPRYATPAAVRKRPAMSFPGRNS